ncbi:putative ATP-dependent RNA helicase [Candidatus Bilamarchaeum dharawalense]|uniref:Putative ATP-dependent RNA helicase n=1 Tax=Candidatus Bilamarchaeum dharawalense TaxID=2885759 RepID=A0A5E4LMM0_9ARCH|nr:putative ATP-dependent RNA helicase [Candidatus Bilamarchaeum dharawalense]
MKFSEMNIDRRTVLALDEMGYIDATEVQEKTIPFILQGESVVVRSQTGTGKTAAFGIGLIEIISKDRTKKCLILAPTRELAVQITTEIRSIAKNHRLSVFAVYGGQGMGHQISALRRGYDIVVATPGRLLDHVQRGTIHLSTINCVVLDEADRMLDMGFKPDIDRILKQINPERQIMLFSATLEPEIKRIINAYIASPEIIEIGPVGKVQKIDEEFIELSRAEKLDRLKQILTSEPNSRTIVFVAAKWAVEEICHKLNRHGIEAKYLHGGKSQTQRERTLREFQEGKFRILIATDVAARGLHVEDISHVINYDQAESSEMHTHRIGRTGRMGKGGRAITFVETDPLPKKRRGGSRGGFRPSSHHNRSDRPRERSETPTYGYNSGNSPGRRNRPRDRRHRRW